MTQMAVRATELQDALTRRFEEVHAEWTAQDTLVTTIRDDLTTPGDEADRANAVAILAEETYRADQLRRQLAEIETARQRLGTAAYGTCEECGTDIPAERLALFPAATLCVACKSRAER
jgi:DnaK suppressor protein